MDQKEQIKKEAAYILKCDASVDYANPAVVTKIREAFLKNNLLQTRYGKAYDDTLKRMEAGESDVYKCVFCGSASGSKLVCSNCRNKMQPPKRSTQQASAPAGSGTGAAAAQAASGAAKKAGEVIDKLDGKSAKETLTRAMDTLTEKVNVMAGGTGKVDLRLKDMFSQVFKKHTREESDELFICGTAKTTPLPEDISTEWPRPWLFSRVALLMLVTFYVLLLCYTGFHNDNVIPGLIFVGSAAIPMAVLVFLFELNAPRNISIFETIKIFAVGGAASLFVTLVLYMLWSGETTIFGAIMVGIIEELGKLIILAYVIKKNPTKNYILNGMLYGGAVGTGFAVFESAGYAMSTYMGVKIWGFVVMMENSFNNMLDVIYLRAFLSPGGHIAWAAMEGAFLMIVLDRKPFTWKALWSPKYLSFLVIPIGMHAFWDMPILTFSILVFPVKLVFLVLLAWVILLVFVHRGLEEINEIGKAPKAIEDKAPKRLAKERAVK